MIKILVHASWSYDENFASTVNSVKRNIISSIFWRIPKNIERLKTNVWKFKKDFISSSDAKKGEGRIKKQGRENYDFAPTLFQSDGLKECIWLTCKDAIIDAEVLRSQIAWQLKSFPFTTEV